MSRVLVTGVGGFLGSHLADSLIADGHEVVGVDNMSGGTILNVPAKVIICPEDCCDLEAMTHVCKDCEVVYHCAASPHEGLSVFSPVHITKNTYMTTVNMAVAAIRNKVKRFVFCSSMARYGFQKELPFYEGMTCKPVDPYGIAKLASEQVLSCLGKAHGMEIVTLVPHNIIGERQRYCMAKGTLVKLNSGFAPIESVDCGSVVRVGEQECPVMESWALGRRESIRLTLKSGQVVTVGKEHRFLRISGDCVSWQQANHLGVGDCIVSESAGCVSFSCTSEDFRFGQLLGLLISDGSYNDTYQVDIACCVEEDKPDLRALLTSLRLNHKEDARGVFHIYSKEFVDKLRSLGMKATAHDKIIPSHVLALSHDTIAGVLSGLFSGDGWINKDSNVVAFASVSEVLIRQVQKVLLAYGIRSHIHLREQDEEREIEGRKINSGPIWWLTVLSENVIGFQKIGFVYRRKQELLQNKDVPKESSVVPKVGFYIKAVSSFLPSWIRSQKPNAINSPSPNGGVTRFSLVQLCNVMDEWLGSDEALVCAEYASFVKSKRDAWVALLSYGHHLEIVAVEEVEEELYDISVESEHHSYVGDGLMSHNCDPYRNVVAIMINRMLQGKAPIIYGDGEQKRCFTYVGDVMECFLKVGFRDGMNGQVINIGPDEDPVTINQLAMEIWKAVSPYEIYRIAGGDLRDFKPVYVEGRPCEVQNAWCSANKARALLGYETKTTLQEAVQKMVAWIKESGPKPFEYHIPLEISNDKTPATWKEKLM